MGFPIAVVAHDYDPYEDCLKQFHTDTTSHTGRTLFEHLKGTRDLLKKWGMPEHVQVAGLFHSIYGTNIFTTPSASFTDRDLLQALIGTKAEWLAYLFCVAKRPKAFFDAFEDNSIHNRFGFHSHMVTNVEIHELIAIEIANHMEQDMGAELVAKVWDRSMYNTLLTKTAMDDMRRFMYKHGITR
jgi:hypothetical protein